MSFITKYIMSALIGTGVGFTGGFQGTAGGFYITMLLLALGIVDTQRQAIGTTLLAIVFPLSIGAVYEYYKSGDIDIVVGLIIAGFYIIAATYGARFNKVVPEKWVVLSLATALFLNSFYFFNRFYRLHTK